ncbi:hypothetical protein QBC39DRAFT_78888 [Podospora conica]|nr:hypothetical protein QBC39DRAFT_78888 [Schizothecium conicum]
MVSVGRQLASTSPHLRAAHPQPTDHLVLLEDRCHCSGQPESRPSLSVHIPLSTGDPEACCTSLQHIGVSQRFPGTLVWYQTQNQQRTSKSRVVCGGTNPCPRSCGSPALGPLELFSPSRKTRTHLISRSCAVPPPLPSGHPPKTPNSTNRRNFLVDACHCVWLVIRRANDQLSDFRLPERVTCAPRIEFSTAPSPSRPSPTALPKFELSHAAAPQ